MFAEESNMPRGNMPDEFFKEKLVEYHRMVDRTGELSHEIISNLVAKVRDLEYDLDQAINDNIDLKRRVEALEALTNPDAGR